MESASDGLIAASMSLDSHCLPTSIPGPGRSSARSYGVSVLCRNGATRARVRASSRPARARTRPAAVRGDQLRPQRRDRQILGIVAFQHHVLHAEPSSGSSPAGRQAARTHVDLVGVSPPSPRKSVRYAGDGYGIEGQAQARTCRRPGRVVPGGPSSASRGWPSTGSAGPSRAAPAPWRRPERPLDDSAAPASGCRSAGRTPEVGSSVAGPARRAEARRTAMAHGRPQPGVRPAETGEQPAHRVRREDAPRTAGPG